MPSSFLWAEHSQYCQFTKCHSDFKKVSFCIFLKKSWLACTSSICGNIRNGLCHLSCLESVCGKVFIFYPIFYPFFFFSYLFYFHLHGEALCNGLCHLSCLESVCGKVLSSQETSACVLGIHKQYTVFRPLIPFIWFHSETTNLKWKISKWYFWAQMTPVNIELFYLPKRYE